MARVRECADLAQIKSDIERMPMGYESLVGDMGSTLSGGQKQRVLLARALYRRPRILILDEGTSHLDVETEKAVNAALSNLAITRLVVAHRPETLRAAGRVVSLEGGVAREVSAVLNHQQEKSYENVEPR
jgi:ATP-binding cassette subfamily B protein RaxB